MTHHGSNGATLWLMQVLLIASIGLRAPSASAAGTQPAEPRLPPPPAGYEGRDPLSPDDYRRKNEGSYFTGLPLAAFDPNVGFGAGARVYYYYNGEREDRRFAYTPYLYRVFLQGFATLGGLQFHWLDFDAPAIAETPYRLRAQAIFARNISQHFFGAGAEAMGELTFTGAGRSYSRWDDYQRDLRRVRADGTTLARYDHIDLLRPVLLVSVERTYLGGRLRPLLGLAFSYTQIGDFTGRRVDAVDDNGDEVSAEMGPSRFSEACDEGLTGCDGGFDNWIRTGISYDTRDFEPDPNSGVYADAAVDISTGALGSEYSYVRFLIAGRYYYSPFPEATDLVLAGRVTLQAQSAGAPFFAYDFLPYTEDFRNGLGGLRTIRGFRQNRFIGPALSLANLELRWTFHQFDLWKQKFGLIAVPFVDAGRVFDSAQDFSFRDWRRGQGLALRISWNLATIVTVDYGFSDEDAGLYVNFNHQF